MRDTRIPDRRQRGLTRLCLWTRCKSPRSLDAHSISKRVVLLGPSHHVYISGIALSRFAAYETPIGDIPLDLDGESTDHTCQARLG